MLKDIKWSMVLIFMSVSLIILFGGWYLYQENNIKEPITNSINDITGVTVDEIKLDINEIELNLTLEKIDKLQVTYNSILNKLQPYLNNRDLTININSNPSDDILEAWSNSYFSIAEAIELKNFSLIPETVLELKKDYSLDQAICTMDNQNIYIKLQQGESSLYIVINTSGNGVEVNSFG
ncbi:MAG: hypothetical protein AB7V16_01770 [Vulcanibacillus sp.]